jgi:hypothetical protein
MDPSMQSSVNTDASWWARIMCVLMDGKPAMLSCITISGFGGLLGGLVSAFFLFLFSFDMMPKALGSLCKDSLSVQQTIAAADDCLDHIILEW